MKRISPSLAVFNTFANSRFGITAKMTGRITRDRIVEFLSLYKVAQPLQEWDNYWQAYRKDVQRVPLSPQPKMDPHVPSMTLYAAPMPTAPIPSAPMPTVPMPSAPMPVVQPDLAKRTVDGLKQMCREAGIGYKSKDTKAELIGKLVQAGFQDAPAATTMSAAMPAAMPLQIVADEQKAADIVSAAMSEAQLAPCLKTIVDNIYVLDRATNRVTGKIDPNDSEAREQELSEDDIGHLIQNNYIPDPSV